MESKELMLGNWVKYAHNSFWIEEIQGQPVQIDIDNYQEIYFDDGGTVEPKYEPIVITPEILEMAGWANYKSYYKYGTVKIWVTGDDEFTTVFSYDHAGVHIKYLHQLQNLFFALTGTHLKIELK